MKKEIIFLIFVLSLALLSLYFLYRIFSPFLESMIWAIFLAIVFYPVFIRLQNLLKKMKVLSALAMTLLVVSAIVLPASFLMVSLTNEAIDFYHQLDEMIKSGRLQAYLNQIMEISLLKGVLSRLNQYVDLSQIDPPGFLLKNVQQISAFLLNQTSKTLKSISTFAVGFLFTLLSLYYLFKDGEHLLEKLKEIVPLPVKENDLIIHRFKEMVSATIYGGILIGVIQGLLGGLSFWLLGLPSPVFWGTVMALFSFIPFGGTALIWGPAAIFFLIQGAYLKGAILLGLGVLLIGMVDNLLRPHFVSARTNIHPLLLFFSVLGGIQAFGMIGLVGGPLVVSLFLTLVEIYVRGIKTSE